MEERTTDDIARIFAHAGHSVAAIDQVKQNYETDAEYKARVKRNVEHLAIIKAYKKVDGTTSIWTSEDFTAIDAAITSGKSKYE